MVRGRRCPRVGHERDPTHVLVQQLHQPGALPIQIARRAADHGLVVHLARSRFQTPQQLRMVAAEYIDHHQAKDVLAGTHAALRILVHKRACALDATHQAVPLQLGHPLPDRAPGNGEYLRELRLGRQRVARLQPPRRGRTYHGSRKMKVYRLYTLIKYNPGAVLASVYFAFLRIFSASEEASCTDYRSTTRGPGRYRARMSAPSRGRGMCATTRPLGLCPSVKVAKESVCAPVLPS